MCKRSAKNGVFCLLLLFSSGVMANGNLHSLIIELENIKGLAQLQSERSVQGEHQRWSFRYDLLNLRIDKIILDIEKHIELMAHQPRMERIELGHRDRMRVRR